MTDTVPTIQQIDTCLQQLVGAMWLTEHRSLDLQALHFGRPLQRRARDGTEFDVGSHVLHIQCAWRLLQNDCILVGSRDRLTPRIDLTGPPDHFDPGEPRTTLCDQRLEGLLCLHEHDPIFVTAVAVAGGGRFTVSLTSGYAFEVVPDASTGEQWRFIDNRADPPLHHVFTMDPEHADWGIARPAPA